jgi:CDP-diacylglycerol---serine O-phosphatidyltransferase
MTSPASSVHPSNLLTYVSLAAGVCAVASALRGSASGAGVCFAAAALADTFDGRFARMFTRTSRLEAIGAELDSLSDVVTFGACPVAALAILSSRVSAPAPWWWWLAGITYVACAMTRLAYYNVANAENGKTFVGLPAPVTALAWSTLLLVSTGWIAISIAAVVLSVAMIAPLRITRPAGGGLTLFALWPVLLICVHVTRL